MSRSNWKGVISFGLVSIPVSLFNSENTSEKIAFHQIDKRNNARIKYQRVNSNTGKEVNWEDVIKGYEYNKETILPLKEEELKKVAGANARTIAIENFIDKDSIHFIDIKKTYYLVPDKKGEKGYVILREALKNSKTVGIAKVIISTKEYLSAIAFYKNALVLYLLRYNNEIRPLTDFDIPSDNLKQYKVTSKEINTALLLIKSTKEKWEPKKYKDEYQQAVHKWAENKMRHKHTPIIMQQRGTESRTVGKNVDFIDLLRKSMKSSKKPHGRNTILVPSLKKKPHSTRKSLH